MSQIQIQIQVQIQICPYPARCSRIRPDTVRFGTDHQDKNSQFQKKSHTAATHTPRGAHCHRPGGRCCLGLAKVAGAGVLDSATCSCLIQSNPIQTFTQPHPAPSPPPLPRALLLKCSRSRTCSCSCSCNRGLSVILTRMSTHRPSLTPEGPRASCASAPRSLLRMASFRLRRRLEPTFTLAQSHSSPRDWRARLTRRGLTQIVHEAIPTRRLYIVPARELERERRRCSRYSLGGRRISQHVIKYP